MGVGEGGRFVPPHFHLSIYYQLLVTFESIDNSMLAVEKTLYGCSCRLHFIVSINNTHDKTHRVQNVVDPIWSFNGCAFYRAVAAIVKSRVVAKELITAAVVKMCRECTQNR